MAEPAKIPVLPWDLTPVTSSPPLRANNRRNPPGASVNRTGRVILNGWASDLLAELIREAGPSEKPPTILPAVNVEAGIIGLYVVDPGTLGSVAPKPIDRNTRFSLDFASVFTDYPDLRLDSVRHCPLNRVNDKLGKACLIIALKGSVIKTRRRMTNGGGQAKTE